MRNARKATRASAARPISHGAACPEQAQNAIPNAYSSYDKATTPYLCQRIKLIRISGGRSVPFKQPAISGKAFEDTGYCTLPGPICSASSAAVTLPFANASRTAASSYSPSGAMNSGDSLSSSASRRLAVRATILLESAPSLRRSLRPSLTGSRSYEVNNSGRNNRERDTLSESTQTICHTSIAIFAYKPQG